MIANDLRFRPKGFHTGMTVANRIRQRKERVRVAGCLDEDHFGPLLWNAGLAIGKPSGRRVVLKNRCEESDWIEIDVAPVKQLMQDRVACDAHVVPSTGRNQ